MDSTTQIEFMYLFERVSQPLYLGGRGSQNIFFEVPLDSLPENERKASAMIREMDKPSMTITIPKPRQVPDVTVVGKLCPKNSIFSYFDPTHKDAATLLMKILMVSHFTDPPDRQEFKAVSATCRDSPMVNSQLWLHAMVGATLFRSDMKGFKVPPLWEIMPDAFMSNKAKKVAQMQANLPAETRGVIQLNDPKERVGTGPMAQEVSVDSSFSGRSDNPENKLWYFREDIAVSSHHWHWHIIYTGNAPKGSRDRKGELFYYMHHSMLARYDAERLCNGLTRLQPLDITTRPVLNEGYFSKLTTENSGQNWGNRQEFTQLRDVNRNSLIISIEDMRRNYDRICEAIDSGLYIDENGKPQKLTVETGINVLGDIVENGGADAPNAKYYGNLHNFGHVVIATSHDPLAIHRENFGPMGSVATAMRDPAFFRWHKFVDNVFDRYKLTLPAYEENDLVWPDVQVTKFSVQPDEGPENILTTSWMQTDVDLSRGLDLGRGTGSNMARGPVWARFTHLNHGSFTYKIDVNCKGRDRVYGTARIYMAPRLDEHGVRLPFSQQRLQFFEMDKFPFLIQPGETKISRKSTDSSVTIPWEQSFRDLEAEMVREGAPKTAVCGCGWPHHLLVPKGTPEGFPFDLFVIITDASKDIPTRISDSTEGQRQKCKESLSFCGVLNEKYPDLKPMGFPFDRKPRNKPASTDSLPMPVANLDEFIVPNSNMGTVQVRVVHRNTVTIRPGGAPQSSYTVLVPEDAVSSKKNRNRRPSNGRVNVPYSSSPPGSPGPLPRARSSRSSDGELHDDWEPLDSPDPFY